MFEFHIQSKLPKEYIQICSIRCIHRIFNHLGNTIGTLTKFVRNSIYTYFESCIFKNKARHRCVLCIVVIYSRSRSISHKLWIKNKQKKTIENSKHCETNIATIMVLHSPVSKLNIIHTQHPPHKFYASR